MNLRSAENICANVIRFFLCVCVFWIPYSNAVIEVCVILALMVWFMKRILGFCANQQGGLSLKNRGVALLGSLRPCENPLSRPIKIFLVFCLLAILWGVEPGRSAAGFARKTFEWFIVYWLVLEVFTTRKQILVAMGIFVFTSLATGADALIQFYGSGRDIFRGHEMGFLGRATAGFKTSNGLGAYLALVIPFMATQFLQRGHKMIFRIFSGLVSVVLVWALICTFSRGAWFGACGGVLFAISFCLYARMGHEQRHLKHLFFVTIFFILAATIVMKQATLLAAPRINTVQWRMAVWEDSLKMVKLRPFFGYGFNTYMKQFQKYRRPAPGATPYDPTFAHNSYLQMLVETGFFGLLAFLGVLRRFTESVNKTIRDFKDNPFWQGLALGLFSGVWAFFIHSFFDNNFYSLQLSTYLWFMMGLSVSMGSARNNEIQIRC